MAVAFDVCGCGDEVVHQRVGGVFWTFNRHRGGVAFLIRPLVAVGVFAADRVVTGLECQSGFRVVPDECPVCFCVVVVVYVVFVDADVFGESVFVEYLFECGCIRKVCEVEVVLVGFLGCFDCYRLPYHLWAIFKYQTHNWFSSV